VSVGVAIGADIEDGREESVADAQPGEGLVETNAPAAAKSRSPAAAADQAGFAARLQLIVQQWPSVDRLAKASGVSPSAFRKWLKGVAEPSRDRLVALAEAAGVNVSWLVQGEGAAPDLTSLAVRAGSPQASEPGAASVRPISWCCPNGWKPPLPAPAIQRATSRPNSLASGTTGCAPCSAASLAS